MNFSRSGTSKNDSRVAYIYSIPELNKYTVEVKAANESFFISNKSEQIFYSSVALASTAAKSQGCHGAFLCLENTYNECGFKGKQERFSCMKIF